MANGIGTQEQHQMLYRFIDGAGGPDKYIDLDEERLIFEKGDSLGIWAGQVEAMLNHRCKQHGWTRAKEIAYYLKIMLIEATKDDGVIDKKEFDHIVGFAVAVRMPRKDALRTCIEMIERGGWKTKNDGLLGKHDWLQEYQQA